MRSVLAVFLLLLCGSVAALEKGERLLPWTLLDQFDKAYTLDQQARILLVARNMTGAKLLNAALEGKPKGFLEARQTVFVADVSRMPAVISTLFAVPAMRDYQYRGAAGQSVPCGLALSGGRGSGAVAGSGSRCAA